MDNELPYTTPTLASAAGAVSAKDEEYNRSLQRYHEELAKFEIQIKHYQKELLEVFHKSQEAFEKQLSYISAGALSLSVGFIQDLVKPIKAAEAKWMLIGGWGALIITLLVNLISHFVAGSHAKKGAAEASDLEKYDEAKINRRAAWITGMNIATVITLTTGIVLVVLFIIINSVF